MAMGRKKTAPRRIGFYALSVLFHASLLGGAVFLAGESRTAVREAPLQVRLSRERSAPAAPEKTISAPPVQRTQPRAARRAPATVSAKPIPKRSLPAKKKTRPRTPAPKITKIPSPPPVREVASLPPAASEPAPPPPSAERKRPVTPLQKIRKNGEEAPPLRAHAPAARREAPRAAPPAGAPGPEDSRRILLQIADRIRKARRYPAAARRMGIEGTAVVSFRIQPGGSVLDLKLRSSSGHPLLDNASLDAVRRAAPLPYLRHALVIPIRYTLRKADD